MILVECKPDKVLVQTLGIPKREVRHAGNKSSICKILERDNGLKGLMDEDPSSVKPPYIRGLRTLKRVSDIEVLYDDSRGNYVIILSPRLEEWVLKAAKMAGIDVIRSYSLPNDGNTLHRIINLRLDNFKRLLIDLRKRRSQMVKDLELIIKGHHSSIKRRS